MPPNEHRTIDFFAEDALPAPRTTPAEAELIAAQSLGINAHAEPLGSQQDANFLLRDGNGTVLAVLKIANPAFGPLEIEAQDTAADLIASAYPDLRVATVLRHPDGTPRGTTVDTETGLLPPACCGICPAARCPDHGTCPPTRWRRWARSPPR